MFQVVEALIVAFGLSSLAQDATPLFNPLTVPKQAPALCDSYLVAISQTANGPAFRRLLFVSQALVSAENGAKGARVSLAKTKGARNFTELWSESLIGQQTWEDHMHCAAQIMSRYAPFREGDPEATFSGLLTVAYNQEAHTRTLLAQSQKRRLIRTAPPSTEEQLNDAEELHRIQTEQSDAGDSITKMGLLAAAEAEDMKEQSANSQRSLLSCTEQKQIMGLLTPVAADADTVFGTTAASMLKILDPKVCKRVGD